MKENIKTPWLQYYGDIPFNLEYPEHSMYDAVEEISKKYPDYTALTFMSKHISYSSLVKSIDATARAFKAYGICEGDRVILCMPNIPQTVYCLYALNKIGAVASMIH
ncbi:MAG: AMP-binding protein, partial [Clostridia bacterium]|nr:AMP-binding protein [Clostridia bacterium]